MKHIILALILSIGLHLLAFYSLKEHKIKEYSDKPSTSKQTQSSIHYVKLQRRAPVKKSIDKPFEKKVVEQKAKVVKKKAYKKVKKVVKQAKRKVLKKPDKTIQRKPIEKVEAIPNYQKLNPTKLQKQTLNEFLAAPVLDTNLLDEVTQSYLKLYGEEYDSFTTVQKVYLQNNLKDIGRITQKYLRYPKIAIRLRKAGTNIVEFVLHPNGDISNLRITSTSGYSFFDKQTLETIEIAYKDYPRPEEKTKIKIYVRYIFY